MKHLFILALSLLTLSVSAQTNDSTSVNDTTEGFIFTTIDSIAITPVKDQHRSGTCWCFSGIGFLESELLRMGKGTYDLSEMYFVHHTMLDRATYYIRQHGSGANFACGGWAYDVLYALEHYGLVPQSVMPGLRYASSSADSIPVHAEIDAVAAGYLKALLPMKKLTPVWREGLEAIYDTYLGKCPETFEYNGKTYTPLTFARSLGLNANDYVSFTSYTHHPFYTRFALEVPDNWRMHQDINLPLDELMEIIDYALAHGYTLIWAADISEPTFTRKGIGVVPDADRGADLTGSDMEHWLGKTDKERSEELTSRPLPEKEITQEIRQQAYDNWETTDDHGMLIFGIAKDQNGKKYYMVKNSWGVHNKTYKGIWYVSEAYIRYKTNEIVVHKDAVPSAIRKNLKGML